MNSLEHYFTELPLGHYLNPAFLHFVWSFYNISNDVLPKAYSRTQEQIRLSKLGKVFSQLSAMELLFKRFTN